jgi:hypothetical protein
MNDYVKYCTKIAFLISMDSFWPSSPSAVVSEAGGSVRPGDSWSTASENRSRKHFQNVIFFCTWNSCHGNVDLTCNIINIFQCSILVWKWLLLGEPCSSLQAKKTNNHETWSTNYICPTRGNGNCPASVVPLVLWASEPAVRWSGSAVA